MWVDLLIFLAGIITGAALVFGYIFHVFREAEKNIDV